MEHNEQWLCGLCLEPAVEQRDQLLVVGIGRERQTVLDEVYVLRLAAQEVDKRAVAPLIAVERGLETSLLEGADEAPLAIETVVVALAGHGCEQQRNTLVCGVAHGDGVAVEHQ